MRDWQSIQNLLSIKVPISLSTEEKGEEGWKTGIGRTKNKKNNYPNRLIEQEFREFQLNSSWKKLSLTLQSQGQNLVISTLMGTHGNDGKQTVWGLILLHLNTQLLQGSWCTSLQCYTVSNTLSSRHVCAAGDFQPVSLFVYATCIPFSS